MERPSPDTPQPTGEGPHHEVRIATQPTGLICTCGWSYLASVVRPRLDELVRHGITHLATAPILQPADEGSS